MNGSSSFTAGQTAVLACRSDSHGDIQLAWMKDGAPLRQDGDDQRSEVGDGPTLTLNDLTTADTGDYVCVGTRDHESVTSTPISISVRGHCLPVSIVSDSPVLMTCLDSLYYLCISCALNCINILQHCSCLFSYTAFGC